MTLKTEGPYETPGRTLMTLMTIITIMTDDSDGFNGKFHLHLLVFPFVHQFNFRIGVLVHSSFAND